MNGQALERAALAIAAKGKPVFPCNIKKRPMTEHGYLDATTDPDAIRALFSMRGVAGIGMPTGPASGLLVIDRDRKNGVDGIVACQELEADLGPLPETLQQRTGSGGDQLFFAYPTGAEIPCSAGKIGPGIDVRSAGGYVIIPPSRNEAGDYAWLNRLQPAPLPQAWIDRLAKTPKVEQPRPCPTITATLSTKYGAAALETECRAVASEPSGGRNARLNAAAYAIGQLVAGGELVESEALTALEQAAAACGLGDHEAQKTIRSGFDAGMAEPRQAPGESDWPHNGGQTAGKNASSQHCASVVTTCAADIEMEAISWLWALWLACGKLHILAGEAGTGKTTIALWLASILSCGGRWPDGSKAEVGNVLIWSGEDDPKDTLVPRLRAAGADLSRVHIISGVQAGQDVRAFDPSKDMEGLLDAAQRIGGVKMLILDPIVNAVSGDSHKNTEVRRGLQPVVDFGTRTGCAILGITHFSKGSVGRSPLERLVGSLAFGALARVVMVAATKENAEDGQAARVFMRAKSNIGPDDGGYGYDLEQTPIPEKPEICASRVTWGKAIDGKARDVLNQAEAVKDSESPAIAEARAFLREALSEGQKTASEVEAEAKEYGIQFRTVRRAKDGLVVVRKGTKEEGGKWFWSLSDQDDQVRCPTKKQGHLGYLGHVTSQGDQLDQDDQEILSGKLGHVTSSQIVEVVI